MVDFDQGGTFRQLRRITLGPSIGPLDTPDEVILTITSAGTTIVPLGYTLIRVNTTSAVTLQLPKFKGLTAIANPLTNPVSNLTIVGNTTAPNITILPGAGEFFDGSLTSAPLNVAFGSRILLPDTINGGALILQ